MCGLYENTVCLNLLIQVPNNSASHIPVYIQKEIIVQYITSLRKRSVCSGYLGTYLNSNVLQQIITKFEKLYKNTGMCILFRKDIYTYVYTYAYKMNGYLYAADKCLVMSDSLQPHTLVHQAPLSTGIFQTRILE